MSDGPRLVVSTGVDLAAAVAADPLAPPYLPAGPVWLRLMVREHPSQAPSLDEDDDRPTPPTVVTATVDGDQIGKPVAGDGLLVFGPVEVSEGRHDVAVVCSWQGGADTTSAGTFIIGAPPEPEPEPDPGPDYVLVRANAAGDMYGWTGEEWELIAPAPVAIPPVPERTGG